MAMAEISNRLTSVDAGIIPENDDVAPQKTQHLAKDGGDIGALEVLLPELEVQAQLPPLGTDRKGRDDRDPIVTIPMMDNRGLSAGRPSLSHGWN